MRMVVERGVGEDGQTVVERGVGEDGRTNAERGVNKLQLLTYI